MSKYEWIRIMDPDGAQKDIFRASKPVYEQIFQPQHRESWSHFRQYILDAEKSRRQRKTDRPLDSYYVGCISVEGGRRQEVRGMALVTAYHSDHLGFISYFGVLNSGTEAGRCLARRGFKEIKEALWTIGMEAVIIEVEKISLSYLEKRGNPEERDEWLERRLSFLKSIQKSQARKVSFLEYLQPILEVERIGKAEEASDLHLMVFPLSRKEEEDATDTPNSLSRPTVERYVKFVYNVFYRDGFDVTDTSDVRKATRYLRSLCDKVLNELPTDLQRIPLGQVALEPFGKHVLISYKVPEDETYMLLLNRYLTDMGIRVLRWKKEAPPGIGRRLKVATYELVQSCDLVIALLTQQFLESRGMPAEIEDAGKMQKPVIALVDGDMGERAKKAVVKRLTNLLGQNVVYLEFRRQRFDLAVYALEKALNEIKQSMAQHA